MKWKICVWENRISYKGEDDLGSNHSEYLILSHELVSLVLSLPPFCFFFFRLNLLFSTCFRFVSFRLVSFKSIFRKNTVRVVGEDFTLLLKPALAQRALCVPKFIELVLVVDHDLSVSCNRTAHDLPSSLLSIFFFFLIFNYLTCSLSAFRVPLSFRIVRCCFIVTFPSTGRINLDYSLDRSDNFNLPRNRINSFFLFEHPGTSRGKAYQE